MDHQARFLNWRTFFGNWLYDERGRASRLAEHLDVSRQNVSAWFVLGMTRPPAWAIMPSLEFFAREAGESNFADVRNPQNRIGQLMGSAASHEKLAADFLRYRIAVRSNPNSQSQLSLNL